MQKHKHNGMHMQKLDSFFQNPPFQNPSLLKIWQRIHALEDSFDAKYEHLEETSAPHTKLPLLQSGKPYLPIEFLRGEESLELFQGKTVERYFLSSGTTAETRSLSNFSHDGLLLYKAQSLKIFRDVMKRFFGENSFSIQGISLVPSSEIWPTSSLAQMLTWIAEFWKLRFVEDATMIPSLLSNEPVWVFATPFQLIQAFDENFSTKLPPNSILFETGGTKGKTRDVQREELYTLIQERFHIPQESIISEYGMCELACQAYDFQISNKKRSFQFPVWVKTFVLPGQGLALKEGEGALLVQDPLRLDYPWPLRTQDIVKLSSDQSFEILGRVPKAVLKGCSLLTEKEETAKKSTLEAPKFLSTDSALQALSLELGSSSAAKSALEDLRESFASFDGENSLRNSQAKAGEHWFFIVPNNHSLAGVYPLVLGALAGLKMTVRIPAAFEDENSFLNTVIHELKTYASISKVSHSFRLGRDKLPQGVQKLCVFGEDETVQSIQSLSPVPVRAFGSGITVSVVKTLSEENARAMAKDMLSLGQKGCLSSRALFVSCPWEELGAFLKSLEGECRQFWKSELTTMQKVAIDHELLAMQRKGFSIFQRSGLNDVLFPIFRRDQKEGIPSQLLSNQPFVLPVFFYGEDREKMLSDLKNFPSLITVSACEEMLRLIENAPTKIRLCHLGKANAPAWDGFDDEKALF